MQGVDKEMGQMKSDPRQKSPRGVSGGEKAEGSMLTVRGELANERQFRRCPRECRLNNLWSELKIYLKRVREGGERGEQSHILLSERTRSLKKER